MLCLNYGQGVSLFVFVYMCIPSLNVMRQNDASDHETFTVISP